MERVLRASYAPDRGRIKPALSNSLSYLLGLPFLLRTGRVNAHETGCPSCHSRSSGLPVKIPFGGLSPSTVQAALCFPEAPGKRVAALEAKARSQQASPGKSQSTSLTRFEPDLLEQLCRQAVLPSIWEGTSLQQSLCQEGFLQQPSRSWLGAGQQALPECSTAAPSLLSG